MLTHSVLLFAMLIGGQFDPVDGKAQAKITDRAGNPISENKPLRNGGAMYFSAKFASKGLAFESVIWEVEPQELHDLCDVVTLLDADGSHNQCILVPYGTDFKSFTVRQYVSLKDTGSVTKVRMKVEGKKPDDDDVKPNPDVPDGEFGLSKLAYSEAMKVFTNEREYEAKSIRMNYLAASQVGGSVDAQTEELRKLNTTNINVTIRSKWNGWRDAMKAAQDKLFEDGKIRTPNDNAKAFQAIANGLQLVK